MDAKKCDACKKYYDFYCNNVKDSVVYNTITLALYNHNGGLITGINKDVCPDCMLKVLAVLNMPKEAEALIERQQLDAEWEKLSSESHSDSRKNIML